MTNQTSLESVLRTAGHSITKQRQLVFEMLQGQEPVTMHQLVAKGEGRIDRASVYRTVALFEEVGVVSRVNLGWKYKIELSDKFAEHHHHLTCVCCGTVTKINESELEQFIEQLSTGYKFMPLEHQIEVQGCCAHCQETGAYHEFTQ